MTMPNKLVRFVSIAVVILVTGCRDAAPPHAAPPRFPIIDIHTHLGGVEKWPGKRPNFQEITRTMQEMNVELIVDFKAPDNSLENGIFGDRVTQRIAIYPDTSKFKLFANIPIDDANDRFVGNERADYPTWVAEILEDAVRRGAVGLKIKDQAGEGEVSYWTKDASGTLVPFDTTAYDPLWNTAERLNIPVIVHLGGAYKGEHQAPNGPNKHVRWEMLMLQRERVLRKHPRLRLIAAHWAGTAGDRTYLEELLEKYPNMYTEGGAHQPKVEFAELDSAEVRFFAQFQDQVMFGTDYMENTFRWLKSYRQRLDMFLPFIEKWPLPDSVMRKYYHGNARRLLKRPNANTTPVAHSGFAITQIVGDSVMLDGAASYGAPGRALRYRWRQVEGTPVRLSSDTVAQPRFLANAAGDLAFQLVVRDDSTASRPRMVRVNVVSPDSMFVEEGGRLTIEAEHFASSDAQSGQSWRVARDLGGYVGDGYVEAGPPNGTSVEPGQLRQKAPGLRYTISVQQPGTYVVYARGQARDSARATVHFGLDNEEARLADRVGEFPVGRWGWARDAYEWDEQYRMTDTTLAVLNIVEPGPHVLNVWMHHDGVMLDRIMLVRAAYSETSKPLFDPGAGEGPAESIRRRQSR
jgi:predicted TIM-barrel fold metal-dependent hydrolase